MPAPGDVGEEDVGDGFLSDDSSFYGDEHLRAELEERAANFDPSHYWSTHNAELSVIAYTNMAQASTSAPAPQELYNMYEGNLAGRQLSETVDAFLSRLPPLTTLVHDHGHWIYIANPRSKFRPTDEDQAGFKERGREILQDFAAEKASIEASMAGKTRCAIVSRLIPVRRQVAADLYAAAREKGCTSGKWLLFPPAGDVDRCWSLVAAATAAGELGHAAKVATGAGAASKRLVCVYTEDFADTKDVRRVLERLVDLGLLHGRHDHVDTGSIYYKADAFSYLGLDRQNEWGLKASLYASKDVLAEERGNA